MLVIIKVLTCVERDYSQFFSHKKWAEVEVREWIIRMSPFTSLEGRAQWKMKAAYEDAVTLYHINLANWNCDLEIPFLCCTGQELDKRNFFEVWKVKVKLLPSRILGLLNQ